MQVSNLLGSELWLLRLTYSHKAVVDKGSNRNTQKIKEQKQIRKKCVKFVEFGFIASTLRKEILDSLNIRKYQILCRFV